LVFRNTDCGKHGALSMSDRDPRNTSCVEYEFGVMPLQRHGGFQDGGEK